MLIATDDFWDIRQGPATDGALSVAEQKLGVELPPAYKVLLHQSDGGYSKYTRFRGRLVGHWLGVSREPQENLVEMYERQLRWDSGVPPRVIVIASTWDSWIALDYRDGAVSPSVLAWSEYRDSPEMIAESFATFLEGLE